jgi:hypothetical protein
MPVGAGKSRCLVCTLPRHERVAAMIVLYRG